MDTNGFHFPIPDTAKPKRVRTPKIPRRRRGKRGWEFSVEKTCEGHDCIRNQACRSVCFRIGHLLLCMADQCSERKEE